MSLIDEALKRARLEAAQRAAESEGMPYPTIPRHLGPQRRRRWVVPAVVALAVIGGVALGLLLAGNRDPAPTQVTELPPDPTLQPGPSAIPPGTAEESSADRPAPAAPMETTPIQTAREEVPPATSGVGPLTLRPAGGEARQPVEPPSPGATTSSPQAEPLSAEAPAPRLAPSPSAAIPAETAPPSPPAGEKREPPAADLEPRAGSPAQGPLPTTTAPAQSSETTEATATAVTDPDSGMLLELPERSEATAGDAEETAENHVQRYEPPDGSAIELGGIAWSETGPFALINGSVVGPGSQIEGYTLERIRPGFVILRSTDRRIRLSLR
jgi:hypothetical protein